MSFFRDLEGIQIISQDLSKGIKEKEAIELAGL